MRQESIIYLFNNLNRKNTYLKQQEIFKGFFNYEYDEKKVIFGLTPDSLNVFCILKVVKSCKIVVALTLVTLSVFWNDVHCPQLFEIGG